MRLSKAWLVAMRDLKLFRSQRNILYSLVIFPVFTSFIFPAVILYAGGRSGGIPAALLPLLLNSFSFFFVIGAAFVPLGIATYSIVGEKVEKSLEPLLATPLTDGEILLGKTISSFLPTLVAMYLGSLSFMGLVDYVTFSKLGYFYFPNWIIGVMLLVLVPVAIVLSVEYSVIISSRVSEVRSASSYGILMFFPFIVIYIASEIGIISLDVVNLLILSGIFLAVDVVLFFVATATFNREEILTKWK